jgi:hypothetical protein
VSAVVSQIQPLFPDADLTMIASRKNVGITSSMSTIQTPTFSRHPSKYASAVPTNAAISVMPIEAMRPIINERPSPRTASANMSAPTMSVPSQWLALGGCRSARKSGSS